MNHLTFILFTAAVAALFAANFISTSSAQLCLIESNKARADNGDLAPLNYDSQLAAAAKYHNDYMVSNNCFDHECDSEPELGQRVNSEGYRFSTIAENIAAGSNDCSGTVEQWLNSEGHRANLLGTEYTQIGCASAPCDCEYGTYWTCVYASPE